MTSISGGGCGGEGCGSVDPWPLHHVRHRGLISRLCTSCVLRCHLSSFCSQCFQLLLDQSPPLLHCSKCQAVTHLSCLTESPAAAADYVCRSCSNGGFSYFPHGDARRRAIDVSSAKALLAAARLAAASMRRAAVAARAEAERKIKEAAVARKRAREMIEIAISMSKKEKESANSQVVDAAEPKKKKKKKKKKKSSRGAPVLSGLEFDETVQGIAEKGPPIDAAIP